jgi:hypothetical protein
MKTLPLLAAICVGLFVSVREGAAQRGWWGGGYHASTAAEGYARGMADVIRSQGQANLLNAQAADRAEDARAKNIENRLRAAEAYYERKRIRESYKSSKRSARRSAYLRRHTIQPLTQEELEPASGDIKWPDLLLESDFDEYRTRFDELFRDRATHGTLSSEEYVEAVNLSKNWRRELTARRDEYAFDQLRNSIRFILKLDKELSLEL